MKKSLKVAGVISAGILILFAAAILLVSPEKRRLTPAVRLESGSEFIRLSEGFTEFEAAGPEDGTPVILIHGLSVPMFDWDPQFNALADAGYRVVRYNQFGRGLSDRPRGTYEKERYVRQLRELIESQGWSKAILVAHSMGGAVAAEFALAHPGMVDRMILISPVLHMAEDNGGIAMIRIPLLGDIAAKTILPGILADRADGLFAGAGVPESRGFSVMFRHQTLYFGFSRSVKSLFRNSMVDDLSDRYRKMDGKRMLLIWGTRDESVPSGHIDRITALIPEMETVIIPDAGHSPNLEVPEEVNRLILDFMER